MSLFKSFLKIGKGFLSGGPAGATRAGIGLLTRQKADSIKTFSGFQAGGLKIGTGSTIYTQPTTPTYDGAPMPGQGMALQALGAACPIGHRLNKSTYLTRGGGTSRWGPAGSILIHPKGTTCVKRRRRNVGNARALRRAISRVKGFVKLARKAHALVGTGRRGKKSRALLPAGTSIVNVD